MLRILCVTDWYLPAFKAGGPVRSISNLVETITQSGFEFYVLTRDRDMMEVVPYHEVPLESWTQVGNARVFYTGDHSLRNFRRRINEIKPDVIYVNSFFSPFTRKILLLRLLGMIYPSAVVVAPRGELSPGALHIKQLKKKLYLKCAAVAGLYGNVLWHATAPLEKIEICNVLYDYRCEKGSKIEILKSVHVASNIPGNSISDTDQPRSLVKETGYVRFLFVSRVSPKKNLRMAIELLATLRGEIKFDIYGPVDDARYWQKCEALIARIPRNVEIRYLGPVTHEEVQKKFLQYHFFLFPSLSENFGHVIVESLRGGCPVVISDQTPWTGLEGKNIGWDMALDDHERWLGVLQRCVDMDVDTYRVMSLDCLRFFREWARTPAICEENIRLFQRALSEYDGRSA